jgi:GT2 family glycosyltransferase
VIAIVVITHNRLPTLRRCVEDVLLRTSNLTTEIVIWDNGSRDGTAAYVESLPDPRFRCIRSSTNVGMNGYARAFRQTKAPYMIELDDDVVAAPWHWDRVLYEAYRKLPEVGFLAADLAPNPHDQASRVRHEVRPHEYHPYEINGIRLLSGPAGGGCAMTSRDVADRVGGFPERPGRVFWQEEWEYIRALERIGLESAVLADLHVLHQSPSGPEPPEKREFWRRYEHRQKQKMALKRLLLRIPLVRPMNRRFEWFQEPSSR